MHLGSAEASVVAAMRPELERSGIKTIDLLTAFVSKGLGTEAVYRRLYLPCDGHWNDAGQRAASETLAPVADDLLKSTSRHR
jgi:hypothetical protein